MPKINKISVNYNKKTKKLKKRQKGGNPFATLGRSAVTTLGRSPAMARTVSKGVGEHFAQNVAQATLGRKTLSRNVFNTFKQRPGVRASVQNYFTGFL